jgi:hypothetical protein
MRDRYVEQRASRDFLIVFTAARRTGQIGYRRTPSPLVPLGTSHAHLIPPGSTKNLVRNDAIIPAVNAAPKGRYCDDAIQAVLSEGISCLTVSTDRSLSFPE